MKSTRSVHQIPLRKRLDSAASGCEREKMPRMRRSTKNVAVTTRATQTMWIVWIVGMINAINLIDVMDGLAEAGVDFDDVTATLEREGVAAFSASYHISTS